MLKSDEVQFYSNSTLEQRIRALYQRLRLRNPDQEGLAFWMAEIEKGTTSEQALENALLVNPPK